MKHFAAKKIMSLLPELEERRGSNILYNLCHVHSPKANTQSEIKILDIPEISSMLALADLGEEYFSEI